MTIVVVLASAVVLSLPASAAADSDGYFCVARGYLAYEVRSATTPSKHELHVVRFSTAGGIVAAQPVILDDFQVHGMRCQPATVELGGWETTYSVDVVGSGRPPTVRSTPRGARQHPEPANVGNWAKAQVVNLDAEGETQFQLVIARASQRVSGGMETHTVSRLIQRGPKNQPRREIVGSLLLFEGVFLETAE